MRRLLVALLLIWSVVVTAVPAAATGGTVDQQQTGQYGYYSFGGPWAQVFTAGMTGGLDQVDLLIGCYSESCNGTIYVEIRAVCDGKPSDTVLTSTTVNLSKWASPGWAWRFESVPFITPVRVTAGKQYALYLYGPAAIGGYGMLNAPDSYSGGEAFSYARGGFFPGWRARNSDIGFKTYVAPPSSADVIPSATACGPSDTTPPVTTATLSAQPNWAGWHNKGVAVTLQAADELGGTGVKQITYNTGAGAVTVSGWNTVVSVEAEGSTTLTYQAEDNAGNSETTQSLTLKIDTVAPVVTITGGGTYDVDQTVWTTCTASDETSGVADSDCQDGSFPAYVLGPGTRTFEYHATDYAGNTGSGQAVINVVVTPEGLSRLTNQFVSNDGVANGLTAKLKVGAVNGYIHEVEALSGKMLAAEEADLLIELAQSLDARR